MPLLRMLAFTRLTRGCLVASYHQRAVDRDVDYVEERGCRCIYSDHQRNQTPATCSSSRHRAPAGTHLGRLLVR